jgi:hypothetical protein
MQRPSLFSASGDDTARIEADTSIMAALDGRLRKPPPSRAAPLWGAAGALALMLGLAAWWWQGNGAEPAQPVVAQAALVSAGQVAVKPPEAASAVASAPASEVLAAAVPAASAVARAVIEESSGGELKSAPVLAQAAPTPAAAAASSPASGPATAAMATATVVSAVASGQQAKTAESRTTETTAKAAKTASAKDSGKANAKAASTKAVEPVAAPATAEVRSPAGKDADVELLAALMRYSDEVAAPGAGKAKAQSGAARMNELTIADLVQRCKALGGDEATQCKKRICSGYWGKADACPAKQAPVASKHKKQAA